MAQVSFPGTILTIVAVAIAAVISAGTICSGLSRTVLDAEIAELTEMGDGVLPTLPNL